MARSDVKWWVALGLTVLVARAAPNWDNILRQDAAWYGTPAARAVADSVLLYQTEAGGWPKNRDMTEPPSAEFLADKAFDHRAPTIDNDATTMQLRFLARVRASAGGTAADEIALLRGLDYLMDAQYGNGGWGQYFPERRGYYTHITLNDDAMVNVLEVLRAVARAEPPWGFVDASRRTRAADAVARGTACLLQCQVVVDGRLTAWCAQHDEVTLAPTSARKFEPASLSGSESVGVVRFLMGIERPGPEVVRAIEAAVAWMQEVAIPGTRGERTKDANGKFVDQFLFADPTRDTWARFYEIGTNRPIFAGRDAVIHYVLAQVEPERRAGYYYYGDWPAKLLRETYPAWRRRVAVESGEPVLFIAGDSTAADKPRLTYPERGWGQALREIVRLPWRVDNRALNGRSTKSFRDEGHWAELLADVSPGDVVLIQFGHNDQKTTSVDRYAAAQTDYRENLTRFVREVRERGGLPWLATSVARRKWNEAGELVPTHGDYPAVVRDVAATENVPLLDLEQRTMEMECAAGPEGSKALHLWIAAGENPTVAESLSDDTHYSAHGARSVAELVATEVVRLGLPLASYVRTDAIVAADGSGDFTSIEKAIYAAPHRGETDARWVIRVKPGVYRERVYVQRERGRIAVVGEDAATTILEAAAYADQVGPDGERLGTFRTPTLQIDGDGFVVENLTIQNSAGPVGQALALRVDGDRVVFRRCRLLGWQDTVLVNRGRQYFEDCRIEGHVDFIFGGATAWFERCEVFARGDGYVTAASTPPEVGHGLVFARGRVGGTDGVRTYLGRPWRDHAATVFMATELGEAVRAEGWHNWNKPHAESTARYAEFDNHGPGAVATARPAWVTVGTGGKISPPKIDEVLGPGRWWEL